MNKAPIFTVAGGILSTPAVITDSFSGKVVAKVYGDWTTSEPRRRAELLAAAPELIEQLKAVILATNGPMTQLKKEIDRAAELIIKIEAEK